MATMTRQNDYTHLEFIRDRSSGMSAAEVAMKWGVSKVGVSVMTTKIRSADRDHDPDDFEPEKYWSVARARKGFV